MDVIITPSSTWVYFFWGASTFCLPIRTVCRTWWNLQSTSFSSLGMERGGDLFQKRVYCIFLSWTKSTGRSSSSCVWESWCPEGMRDDLPRSPCWLWQERWGLFGLCLFTPWPLPAEAILLRCSMLTWSQEGMDRVGWTRGQCSSPVSLLPRGVPLISLGLQGIHRQVGKADEPFCFLWGGHYTCHRPWVKFLSAEYPSSKVLSSSQPKPLIWALGVKSLPMTFKPKAS